MLDFFKHRNLPSKSMDKILISKGYKLFRQIGEGTHSKVYLGEFKLPHEKSPLTLACKVTNTRYSNPKVTKFLARELKILVKIAHPYIIQLHSIFYRKMKYYIFMRYAEKGDLLEYIKLKGPLTESHARVWTRQIALGLQYLHILGIAHRDLKCENILITASKNLKIGDFGFAKYVETISVGASMVQLSETFCGSLSYVAPEIIKRRPYNAKLSDMWSFGVVIFTMLNRSFPFNPQNAANLYDDQINKNWSFRLKYAANASKEVLTLIGNLLEPDVEKRYNIEQVLNSPWMTMDSKLKVLNPLEFEALTAAMDASKSLTRGSLTDDGEKLRRFSSIMKKVDPNRETLTVCWHTDGKFDIHHIKNVSEQKLL